MGDNHKQKDYYDRRDGRPEMKYHGTMGVTLFLMVLLTGICLVYVFMMLRVAPEKVSANREIVENEMFRFEIDEMGSFSNLSGDMLGIESQSSLVVLWDCDVIYYLSALAVYFMVCEKHYCLCCSDEGTFFKNYCEICPEHWICFTIHCNQQAVGSIFTATYMGRSFSGD